MPYLTAFIYGRNDGYGGNQNKRLSLALLTLLTQFQKFRIDSEILIVNWNTDPEKPGMGSLVPWPESHEFTTVREIWVPPKFHKRVPNHKLREYASTPAMNVAVRRARGTFLLPKSCDSIYPDEMIEFISKKTLDPKKFYRCERWDLDEAVLSQSFKDHSDLMKYARDHILRKHGRLPPEEGIPVLFTNASGDFILSSKKCFTEVGGFWERDLLNAHNDSLLIHAALASGYQETVLSDPMAVYKIVHGNTHTSRMREWKRRDLISRLIGRMFFLKESMRNRLCVAYEEFLYRRFGIAPWVALASGSPTLTYWEYLKIVRDMHSGRRSPILNAPGWGLQNEKLPEKTWVTARYETQNPNRDKIQLAI